MSDTTAVHPKFHHFNLKTTRLQEMIDWYGDRRRHRGVFQDATGAWLSNDAANHRVALLAFPGFADDPDRTHGPACTTAPSSSRASSELNSNYLRLREAGITPDICIDHGMTFSYYYKDPDGNHVELQCDNFGDWAASKTWMQTSEEFHANPIGHFVDAEKVSAAAAAGEPFAEIHRRAMADELAPAQAPIEIPTEG